MELIAILGTEESDFGPGVAGFLVTFFLAVTLTLLIVSMSRKIRKVRYQKDNSEEPINISKKENK